MIEDHEDSSDLFIRRMLSELLSGLATITMEHLGLLRYLQDRGIIDRERYDRFLESYRAEHFQEILDEMKRVYRADWGDDLGDRSDR